MRSGTEGIAVAESPGSSSTTRWAWFVVAILALTSIGTPLIGSKVFYGTDVLLANAPWRSTAPVGHDVRNPIIGDTIDVVMPTRAEFVRRVQAGDYPEWNPYPAGGSPLGVIPDPGTLSPLNLPYLVLPIWYAPALVKLLEMLVAVALTYLFLRRVGTGATAAVVGGLVFVNSGFQVVWTNWPHTHVAAMIPGMFWAVERAVQQRTMRSGLPLAAIVAVALLEGFPAVAGYGLLAAGGYAFVRILCERADLGAWLRASAGLAGATLLGFGVAAIQLLPFMLRLQELDLSYRLEAESLHLTLPALGTALVPNLLGSVIDGNYFGSPNYVEAQSFVGAAAIVLVLCLAVIGSPRGVRRGAVPYLAAATLVVLVVAYLGGPLLSAFQGLPLLGSNFIGRIRSLLGFLVAVLAALGFERLVHTGPRERTRGWRLAAFAAAVFGVVLLVAGLFQAWSAAGDAQMHRYVAGQAVVPVLAGAIMMSALIAWRRGGRFRRWVLWIAPALIAVESFAFAFHYWPRVPRSTFYPANETITFLQQRLGRERMGHSGAFVTGTTTYYRLRSVTAHVFFETPWKELLEKLEPGAFDRSATYPFLDADPATLTSPLLDRLSTRFFVVNPTRRLHGVRTAPTTSGWRRLDAGDAVEIPIHTHQVRGINLKLRTPGGLPRTDAYLRAELRAASGAVIGRGFRRILPGGVRPSFHLPIAEPRATGHQGPWTLRLEFESPAGRIELGTYPAGHIAYAPVPAVSDGLRLVHAGGAVVYERLNALPRIRWASRTVEIRDWRSRLDALARSLPPDTVVLSATGPEASGRSARVRVLEDAGDRIMVRVDADGDGYLVVADSLQHGWAASIDGRPTELRPADHALGAVFVPRGRHQVELTYNPRGWDTGRLISVVSLVLLLVLTVGPSLRRIARRARQARS